mmetsp:Transcript_11569/g.10055  ORF Transcript_11569/g.10055 Transcript_11569/m.10055 type:complete len:246 (-) Transcript_11569:1204-1941(-)
MLIHLPLMLLIKNSRNIIGMILHCKHIVIIIRILKGLQNTHIIRVLLDQICNFKQLYLQYFICRLIIIHCMCTHQPCQPHFQESLIITSQPKRTYVNLILNLRPLPCNNSILLFDLLSHIACKLLLSYMLQLLKHIIIKGLILCSRPLSSTTCHKNNDEFKHITKDLLAGTVHIRFQVVSLYAQTVNSGLIIPHQYLVLLNNQSFHVSTSILVINPIGFTVSFCLCLFFVTIFGHHIEECTLIYS